MDLLDNKIVGWISLVVASTLLGHALGNPSTGSVGAAVLAVAFAGLVGVPAIMKKC